MCNTDVQLDHVQFYQSNPTLYNMTLTFVVYYGLRCNGRTKKRSIKNIGTAITAHSTKVIESLLKHCLRLLIPLAFGQIAFFSPLFYEREISDTKSIEIYRFGRYFLHVYKPQQQMWSWWLFYLYVFLYLVAENPTKSKSRRGMKWTRKKTWIYVNVSISGKMNVVSVYKWNHHVDFWGAYVHDINHPT